MSSIKCEACGLYNFKTMENCQRCGQTLNNEAAQMSYEMSVQNAPVFPTQPVRQSQPAPTAYQGNQSPYQSYPNQTAPFQPALYQPYQPAHYNPPPPPQFHGNYGYQEEQFQQSRLLCVKCGGGQNISTQYFKKDYVPPVAYLAILMGFLPGAIIIALCRVKHDIHAPFCTDCWNKFRKVSTFETLSTLSLLAAVFVGGIAAAMTQSGFAFLFFFAASVSFIIWAQIYKSKNSVKFKKVDRQKVVIDAPGVGDMCFMK